MRIFITGGNGFLGRHLSEALRAAGHAVTAPSSSECDLTREGCFAPWRGVAFDRIWHLAAWTQAGDFCLKHPGEQWIKNQQMNTQVLAWWSMEQPQAKLISIGTSCAYAPELPLREEHYLDGQPIQSLFTYAMTKRMMRVGLSSLEKQFGVRHLTLVPSTLYGPGYHTDGRQLHFIFDLIRKILRGKTYGEPVVLWGDGYQRRELIHVDDFVRTAVWLADRVDNDLVNIGCGYEHTIREFAGLICAHVGFAPENVAYDTSKYVGAKSKCLEITKLKTLCPDFSPTPLERGLPAVIDWMREHHLGKA
ncbi:GDP-fucose synthetase [Nibricoccus aquaticus]|uniref:GDP-fucose synthetase n=1 Tax=Nibricoccus aquaticus TaxID=2576891 RepID=A0A290Q5Z7_9BACT|nr:NAD-dependent epimerase/dehydratase family protein [Nibricoccus aquaticus]ATC64105.1 GDP-fucose synthetase [Nibricoccus aquaticus]